MRGYGKYMETRTGSHAAAVAPPRWAQTLPKAHLHIHLGGACPDWLWDQKGLSKDFAPLFRGDCLRDGFEAFELHHGRIGDLIRRHIRPSELLDAIAVQAAAEGTRWVELHVDPDRWQSWCPLEVMAELCRNVTERRDVGLGIVVLAARRTPENSLRTARRAVRIASTPGSPIVGFGLAGDQSANPIWDFAPAFGLARSADLAVVPHAGEYGTDTGELEWCLQHDCTRIAHGVAAVHDPSLMWRLAAAGICLDVAPTSNARMGYSTLRDHPIEPLSRAGVRCSLNTDNPLMVRGNLAQEYARVCLVHGYSMDEMAVFARRSIDAAAAPRFWRDRMRQDLQDWYNHWL